MLVSESAARIRNLDVRRKPRSYVSKDLNDNQDSEAESTASDSEMISGSVGPIPLQVKPLSCSSEVSLNDVVPSMFGFSR